MNAHEEECTALMEKIRIALFGEGQPRTDVAIPVLVRALAGTAISAKLGNEDDCLALDRDIMDVLIRWEVMERVQ